MLHRKKSSASVQNIFTQVTDTLLPWNKLRGCSNKKDSCNLPLLTDNKVKESHWLHGLKVALPQKVDTWRVALMAGESYHAKETLHRLFVHLVTRTVYCNSTDVVIYWQYFVHLHSCVSVLILKFEHYSCQRETLSSTWVHKSPLSVLVILSYLVCAIIVPRMFLKPHMLR